MTARASDTMRQNAFEALHTAGWSDWSISCVLRARCSTIETWRAQRQLRANRPRTTKICNTEARRLYGQGVADPVIANRFGVCHSAVVRWRQRQGLPANFPQNRLTSEQKRKAKLLLRYGASRRQVADAIGISDLGAIQRIRSTMNDPGLRRTGHTNRNIRSRIRKDANISRRIERAVGSSLPMDVRMEATAELYVAVLDGMVSADCIEQVAPSYRNRAYEMCGCSKFGARSLNEEIGEDWTLVDSLDDPSALEAMEAAAETAWNDN